MDQDDDYTAHDAIIIKRLTFAQMKHHDCLLLGQITKCRHQTIVIFNPELGNFSLKALIERERIYELADVFVETPELILGMYNAKTSWEQVAWEIRLFRQRLGSDFSYPWNQYPLQPVIPKKRGKPL